MRYFLELSYKGTQYSGFQVQRNAVTVQEAVQRALQTVFRQDFELTGSSRTDAGVHARQNFFHFDTELDMPAKTVYNLNAVLPKDIAVRGIYPVPDQAHCRFDAEAREYKYLIYSNKNPFLTEHAWLYPYPVDQELLQQAAAQVSEYSDFTSFSKRNTQVKTFECRILESEWNREGALLTYRVKANRFLRGMVRGLVGTMLQVGRGRQTVAEFRKIIEGKDCRAADFSTPAHGLYLERVIYGADLVPLLQYS